MLTANTEVGTAVAAMKQGAFHYANKPFDLDEIVLLVEKALETTQLRREVRTLRARQAQPYGREQHRRRERRDQDGARACCTRSPPARHRPCC